MKFATLAILAVAQAVQVEWKDSYGVTSGNPTRQELSIAAGALNTGANALVSGGTHNDALAISGDKNRHSHTTTRNVAVSKTVDDSYNVQVPRTVVNTVNDIATVRSSETVFDVRSRQVDASRVDIVPEVRSIPIDRVETYTELVTKTKQVPVKTYKTETSIEYDTKVDYRTRKVPTQVCSGGGQKYCNKWVGGWCKDWQYAEPVCKKTYVEEDYTVETNIPREVVTQVPVVHYETETYSVPVEKTRTVRDTVFKVVDREVPHGTYRAVVDHIPRQVNTRDTVLVPRQVTSIVKDTVRVPRTKEILVNEVVQDTIVHSHAGGKGGAHDHAGDSNGDGLIDVAGVDADRVGAGIRSDEVVVRRAGNPSGPARGHRRGNRYARKGAKW